MARRRRQPTFAVHLLLTLLLPSQSPLRTIYPASALTSPSSSSSSRHAPPPYSNVVPSHPCLGRATTVANAHDDGTARTTYYVIGTSHLRCQSAAEVTSLLRTIRPDGVVVELDPERVIRLSTEGASRSRHNRSDDDDDVKEKEEEEQLLYGADFLAAIDTAKEMDVPLFVGDEYQKETKERFLRTALDPRSYAPGPLLTAVTSLLLPQRTTSGHEYVNLLRAFAADPEKLTPLAATAAPVLLLFLATIGNYRFDDIGNDAATALSLSFSFFATCKFFNNFISDRDDVLAREAARAAGVMASVKRRDTVRARWEFIVDGSDDAAAAAIGGVVGEAAGKDDDDGGGGARIPLFTLKTPLASGQVRNLNLFEPRWLKMIDDACSRPGSVFFRSFGCVVCTNKFYSAVRIDGAEGRYADVIFKRRGTMARITDLVEGTRPVSGDRKVGVRIEGGEPFLVDESKLAISKEGYLVASGVVEDGNDRGNNDNVSLGDNEEDIKIVVVVGLLHANGVIQRLATG